MSDEGKGDMSEEEKEVLAMFNSVGLNIEVDNKAAALWFSLGGVFVKKIIALRTQLDAYKAALEKIAKRKSGEYIIDAYYEIRKIAEEVLQTKGVE